MPRTCLGLAMALCLLLSACGASPVGSGAGHLSGKGSTKAKALTPVTIGLTTKALGYLPVFVAQNRGLFRAAGLNVKLIYFTNASPAFTAIKQGDVQFVGAGAVTVMEAQQHGLSLRAIAAVVQGVPDELTIRKSVLAQRGVQAGDPLAQRLGVLRGLKLGIEAPGGVVDALSRYLVHLAGLRIGSSPSKTEVVSVGSASDLVTFMEHGQIDGFVASPPQPEETVAKGFGTVVVTGREIPLWAHALLDVIATTPHYTVAYPGVVRAVATAIASASRFIALHPRSAEQSVATLYPGIDAKVLYASIQAMKGYFAPGARMSTAGWQAAATLNLQTGLLKRSADVQYGDIWTNQFLPAR